jgi:hypothetical protein
MRTREALALLFEGGHKGQSHLTTDATAGESSWLYLSVVNERNLNAKLTEFAYNKD